MSSIEHKIAVIGGGIAGATACLRLLQNGYKPIWIAAKQALDAKPGEHLSPAARPLLKEIDALDLLDQTQHREANNQFSAWGNAQLSERSAMLHLEGAATVVNRVVFEQDLRQKVLMKGITPLEGTVKSVQKLNNQWQINTETQALSADYIIDATGRGASIAKHYATRCRADELVAAIGFLKQKPNSTVEASQATLIETTENGWWYASLLADGCLAVNYYTDSKLLDANMRNNVQKWRDCIAKTQFISHWIEDAEFIIKTPPKIYGAATTWLAPVAGEGWLAIGDAAAAFDPLSSHGMTTALWTAITAADAIHSSLNNDPKPIQSYSEKVAMGVQEFLISRQQIYAMEKRFSDNEFWKTRVNKLAETEF